MCYSFTYGRAKALSFSTPFVVPKVFVVTFAVYLLCNLLLPGIVIFVLSFLDDNGKEYSASCILNKLSSQLQGSQALD